MLKQIFRKYDFRNNEFIYFPLENLDLKNYISGPYKENSKYDLFSVCKYNGYGRLGHYTANCKNIDENWYKYDDDSVNKCLPQYAISSEAYILFYRNKNL